MSLAAHMGVGELVRQALSNIPVRLNSRNCGKYVYTYAFSDYMSTATFCTEKKANFLHFLKGKKKIVIIFKDLK